MIRLTIAAVGKLDKMYATAVGEYVKRLQRFAKAEVAECKECGSGGSEKESLSATEKEGQELLQKSKGVLVVLDKGGEELSSEELADFIGKRAVDGASQFTFIVGGSDGLSKEVLAKAEKRISFGRATYPHQLARLIIAEQLYRAMTILNNVTYHK